MLFQIAAFPFLVFYFPESNLCLFLRPEIFCPQLSQGNILIPAFSIGRTQELLYVFKRYFQAWGLEHWLIFLGSPMAIEATAVYRRHRRLYDAPARALWAQEGDLFDLPNLRVCPDPDDSRRLNAFRSGAIIIAGSGMCTGGRIKQRLKHQVWREHTHVIITGFQSQGTLGRALVDGARYIHL